MYLRNLHPLVILALVGSLGFSTAVSVQAQEPDTIIVGRQVKNGLSIAVALEAPKVMQMMMKGMGMWRTFQPRAGALTHHLTLILTDPETGQRIPYANAAATITNRQTRAEVKKNLPAMLGEELIYGVNIFLEPGTYDLVITVEPPTAMRVEGSIDKWLEPAEASFVFEVK